MRAWWLIVGLVAGLGCDDGGGDPSPPVDDMLIGGDMLPDQALEPEADAGETDMMVGVGELMVDTTFVDFGTVGINGRAEQEIVLSNVGDGPLTVTALDGLVDGFGTSRQPPIRIPADAERTLVLEFRPAAGGRVTGTLTLTTDVPDAAPTEIQLVGVGGEPEGMLVADLIDFGTVAPGEPTAAFIQVTSVGEIPLTVRAVEGVMPPFSIPEGQIPATAEGGIDAQVLVQFQADEEGDFEQMVTVRTDAGDWPATLRARTVAVGNLAVHGVDPAWAPTDTAVTLNIHGGPFDAMPTRILVGETELADLERVDVDLVRGTLPAGGAATGTDADLWDVRVEIGGQFGLATAAFIRTGPVDGGSALDAEAIAAGGIGPEGNPWQLAVDAIPDGVELAIAAGTVVLGDGRTLAVDGVLRSGGEGINVFSTAAQAPGAWGGLRFGGAVDSSLENTVIEYAGADGLPAIVVDNASTFTNVHVRQSAGDGIEVGETGTLVVLGGQFTDLEGDAMRMLGAGGWFRLSNTWIRRVTWPIAAAPNHFGRRPLGLGHDWRNTRGQGIGIGGAIAAPTTLGNQPAGVVYSIREPLTVAADASLTLAEAAPLRLDGSLRVDGRLVLPGGVRIETGAGGILTLGATATLLATGTPAQPVTFEARVLGGDPAPGGWIGVRGLPGASVEATRLIIRDAGADGPALQFDGDLGAINGLRIEDTAGPALQLGGDAEIATLELRGNARGVLVQGGTGRLAGVSEDAAPAVEFAEPALCAAWETQDLLDGMGMPAPTNCE